MPRQIVTYRQGDDGIWRPDPPLPNFIRVGELVPQADGTCTAEVEVP